MTATAHMQSWWTPSAEQDAAAADAIRKHRDNVAAGRVVESDERGVYTVQLLLNKQHGWWDDDVTVVALPGIQWSREAAHGACQGAIAAYRLDHPDAKVSASYCWHSALDGEISGPPMTADGRKWQTFWHMSEAYEARRSQC